MAQSLPQKWKAQQSRNIRWNEAVFEDLERFVDNRLQEDVKKFKKTGDLDDLYAGASSRPQPSPSPRHQDYMQFYAEHNY